MSSSGHAYRHGNMPGGIFFFFFFFCRTSHLCRVYISICFQSYNWLFFCCSIIEEIRQLAHMAPCTVTMNNKSITIIGWLHATSTSLVNLYNWKFIVCTKIPLSTLRSEHYRQIEYLVTTYCVLCVYQFLLIVLVLHGYFLEISCLGGTHMAHPLKHLVVSAQGPSPIQRQSHAQVVS